MSSKYGNVSLIVSLKQLRNVVGIYYNIHLRKIQGLNGDFTVLIQVNAGQDVKVKTRMPGTDGQANASPMILRPAARRTSIVLERTQQTLFTLCTVSTENLDPMMERRFHYIILQFLLLQKFYYNTKT